MKWLIYACVLTGWLVAGGVAAQQPAWDSYTVAYAGGAGTVVVDMGLKQQAPLKDYAYVMMVAISYTKCAADGFPEEAEVPNLERMTDTVKNVVAKVVESRYAGNFTHRCQRQEFYYLHDTAAVRNAVAKACSRHFPAYTIDIKIKEDAAWNMYTSFLYPNEQVYDYMQNQKVLMQLQQRGDALTAEHLVEHWLYFATAEDREHFIVYALQAKFHIDSKELSKESKLKYELKISRSEQLSITSISQTTWQLRQQAKLCQGEYDGWQAHVIK